MGQQPRIHHVAFACRDLAETDHFYSNLLGMNLVNTEVQRRGEGVLKHVFYDTGDGSCIAFFHLHKMGEPEPLKTAISTDLGLPNWVNHVAFRTTEEDAQRLSDRLTEAGIKVEMALDHGWCYSRYFTDPNGILVELCVDRPGMPVDSAAARAALVG